MSTTMKYSIDVSGMYGSQNWGDGAQNWGIYEYFARKNYNRGDYFFQYEAEIAAEERDTISIVNNNPFFYYTRRDTVSKYPVFVGSLLMNTYWGSLTRHNIKNYDLPFLCRDRRTALYLKHYGYKTVLWGCPSLLLPKRFKTQNQTKIFCCDIPDTLLPHIPNEIKNEMTDIGSAEHEPSPISDKAAASMFNMEFIKNRLEKLRNEARLVITSRLHVAAPCLAMGIPVILTIDHLDFRFDVLEPFIPLYSINDYAKINWNPTAPDIEDIKDKMCNIFEAVLEMAEHRKIQDKKFKKITDDFPPAQRYNAPHRFKPITMANYAYFLYEESPYLKYSFFERIIGKKIENVDLLYYGCGHIGKHFFNSTYTLIQKARSFAFVDNSPKYEGLSFEGYKVLKMSDIARYKKGDVKIIITANGFSNGVAHSIADSLSQEYGFVDGDDFFLYELLMIMLTEYNINDPYTLTTRMISKVSTTHDIFKILP